MDESKEGFLNQPLFPLLVVCKGICVQKVPCTELTTTKAPVEPKASCNNRLVCEIWRPFQPSSSLSQ